MSVRIWLKKDGDVEVARLQNFGVLANLKIHEHHTTGKKYIRLGVSLTDPTEEVPQIPQVIVERVTFKGKVKLLRCRSEDAPNQGSYHSADMATQMVISETELINPRPWCQVSVTGPSMATVQEILQRLTWGDNYFGYGSRHTHISEDARREEHRKEGNGCFRKLEGILSQ